MVEASGYGMSRGDPDCKYTWGTEARKALRRRGGFILVELLVVLTISAIAFSLFWQASKNRMHMLTRLEGNYALSRLEADIAILRAAGRALDDIEPSHYSPLNLKIRPEEIQLISKTFKTEKILKK